MTDVLTTRDGLIGNSPRYQGYTNPPYQRYLKDDSGAAINLTGVGGGAFALVMVNQSNPMLVKTGGGTFRVVPPATQGLISYAYAREDLDNAGNWWLFLTVQIPGESGPRAFDPDLLCIHVFPGGFPIVTIQQVDLEQLGGSQISSSNPVPISGSVTIADGANVAQGSVTDSSAASTQIGLLKAIKAYLAGTLTTTGSMTETNSASILADANSIVAATANTSTATGTQGDAAWSGSGNGSEIAILKKLVAELAGTLNMSVTTALPAGTNVIGHVIADNGSTTAVTSLPTLPSGTNVIGHVVVDSASSVAVASLPTLPAGTNLIGGIQQADLTTSSTISAAQPVIGSTIANATVALALAEGQSTWKAQLLAGGGGFTSGTTIVVDKSLDGGTTWLTSSFKVGGSLTNTTVQSIVGPGPLELTGNAAGVSHVRIRCSVLNSTETVAVTLRGGAGTGDVGLMSSIPAGSNNIGSVNVANANANGQAAMANSAPVTLANNQPGLSQMANADGLTPANVLAAALYLLSAGGPPDSSGKPQSAALDRLASWQGKGIGGSNGNITATVAGDNSLAFSSAPKTIMPGAKIQLAVGNGAAVETVIVSNSYTPSSTATSIPLQYPVVNAGSTTAKYDVFSPLGPAPNDMLPTDLALMMLAAYDPNGALPVALITAALDGRGTTLPLMVNAATYNGSTMDRARGNTDVTLLASAARTTTQTSADQVNYNGRGIKVVLDATVIGTGSITLTINYKDPASGKYILLLSGAAVATNSTNIYTIYPGETAVANTTVNDVLPRTFQIIVTANNANSVTYSCGYSIIL